jgi:hypothetical protein
MSLRLVAVAVALAAISTSVEAKSARCYTSDDGEYDCNFVATDSAGSFEISASGKPTFSLVVDEPGVASGFGDYGSGSKFLPGRFIRSDSDPACWDNDTTGTQICAW